MSRHTKTTTTEVQRTITRREVRKAMAKADLTNEEELVMRMRLGLAESVNAQLDYRGQGDEELALVLANMEAATLHEMRPRTLAPVPEEGGELKKAIISKLRKL